MSALPQQMDGSVIFARLRQCALLLGHIGATWRIWLNSSFPRPTGVHNPNGKSIGSAVVAYLMAESPYTYSGRPFPKKLPLPIGGAGPHLIHGSLGPPKSSTQTPSRSVQLFLQGSLVWQTDRQTDRPRYSVSNNGPHLLTYYCDAA